MSKAFSYLFLLKTAADPGGKCAHRRNSAAFVPDRGTSAAPPSLPQVRLLDPRVGGDVGGGALESHGAGLEHVGAVGVAQRRVRVLLDEQDRRPLLVDLLDGL